MAHIDFKKKHFLLSAQKNSTTAIWCPTECVSKTKPDVVH